MTETRAVSIEDVRSLVGERQRFDDWLSALEARRAETPSRVFDRVHGDYSARRSAVMEQLRTHVDTLASLADDLDTKLNALEESLASLEDERVEAMLRTAVGEFDDDRWEQVRKDVEAKIAERTIDRTALLTEADDVRTLLSSARNEPVPLAPVTPAETPTAHVPAPAAMGDLVDLHDMQDDILPVASAEGSNGGATVQLSERVTDTDLTPVITDAVTDEVPALETHENQAKAEAHEALDIEDALALFSPAGTAPAPEVVDSFDDLAFLRSVIDPAGESAGGRQATQAPSQSSVQAPAPQFTQASAAASTEPQKTLRCTECGTMNLPTEWYCERCGGELAAF